MMKNTFNTEIGEMLKLAFVISIFLWLKQILIKEATEIKVTKSLV